MKIAAVSYMDIKKNDLTVKMYEMHDGATWKDALQKGIDDGFLKHSEKPLFLGDVPLENIEDLKEWFIDGGGLFEVSFFTPSNIGKIESFNPSEKRSVQRIRSVGCDSSFFDIDRSSLSGKGLGGVQCSSDCSGFEWNASNVLKLRELEGFENFELKDMHLYTGHHPACRLFNITNGSNFGTGEVTTLGRLSFTSKHGNALTGKGFGGIPCSCNCVNYAWDSAVHNGPMKLATCIEDWDTRNLANYRGHHPSCSHFNFAIIDMNKGSHLPGRQVGKTNTETAMSLRKELIEFGKVERSLMESLGITKEFIESGSDYSGASKCLNIIVNSMRSARKDLSARVACHNNVNDL